jgi:hypothetical protein
MSRIFIAISEKAPEISDDTDRRPIEYKKRT